MRDFIEEEHPRDDDGKFSKKGEGSLTPNTDDIPKIEKAIDDLGQNEKITSGSISLELKNFINKFTMDEIAKSSGWLSGIGKEDKVMKKMISFLGKDKKPKVVSKEAIDSLVNNGAIGFMRGTKVSYGAEQYANGEMYVGRGVSGSGVYVAAYQKNGEVFGAKESAEKTANSYGLDKSTGQVGSIIYGALEKDAKIIKKSELDELYNQMTSNFNDLEKRVFYNKGRFALALGYDAVDCENSQYAIILNRGKTLVGE